MFYARFKREENKDATRRINGKTEFNPEYVHWLEEQLKIAEKRPNKVNRPDAKLLVCEHMREGSFCKVIEDLV